MSTFNKILCTPAKMERIQNSLISASAKASRPDLDEWKRHHSELVDLLVSFGTQDLAQTGDSGDFWVGEEWQNSNYFPIVANTWKFLQEPVISGIGRFLSKACPGYLATIVRPFPKEMWGLQILITPREIYSTCRQDSFREVEAALLKQGLAFLLPKGSAK